MLRARVNRKVKPPGGPRYQKVIESAVKIVEVANSAVLGVELKKGNVVGNVLAVELINKDFEVSSISKNKDDIKDLPNKVAAIGDAITEGCAAPSKPCEGLDKVGKVFGEIEKKGETLIVNPEDLFKDGGVLHSVEMTHEVHAHLVQAKTPLETIINHLRGQVNKNTKAEAVAPKLKGAFFDLATFDSDYYEKLKKVDVKNMKKEKLSAVFNQMITYESLPAFVQKQNLNELSAKIGTLQPLVNKLKPHLKKENVKKIEKMLEALSDVTGARKFPTDKKMYTPGLFKGAKGLEELSKDAEKQLKEMIDVGISEKKLKVFYSTLRLLHSEIQPAYQSAQKLKNSSELEQKVKKGLADVQNDMTGLEMISNYNECLAKIEKLKSKKFSAGWKKYQDDYIGLAEKAGPFLDKCKALKIDMKPLNEFFKAVSNKDEDVFLDNIKKYDAGKKKILIGNLEALEKSLDELIKDEVEKPSRVANDRIRESKTFFTDPEVTPALTCFQQKDVHKEVKKLVSTETFSKALKQFGKDAKIRDELKNTSMAVVELITHIEKFESSLKSKKFVSEDDETQELKMGLSLFKDLCLVIKQFHDAYKAHGSEKELKALLAAKDLIDQDIGKMSNKEVKAKLNKLWNAETKKTLEKLPTLMNEMSQKFDFSPKRIQDFEALFNSTISFEELQIVDLELLMEAFRDGKITRLDQETMQVLEGLDLEFTSSKTTMANGLKAFLLSLPLFAGLAPVPGSNQLEGSAPKSEGTDYTKVLMIVGISFAAVLVVLATWYFYNLYSVKRTDGKWDWGEAFQQAFLCCKKKKEEDKTPKDTEDQKPDDDPPHKDGQPPNVEPRHKDGQPPKDEPPHKDGQPPNDEPPADPTKYVPEKVVKAGETVLRKADDGRLYAVTQTTSTKEHKKLVMDDKPKDDELVTLDKTQELVDVDELNKVKEYADDQNKMRRLFKGGGTKTEQTIHFKCRGETQPQKCDLESTMKPAKGRQPVFHPITETYRVGVAKDKFENATEQIQREQQRVEQEIKAVESEKATQEFTALSRKIMKRNKSDLTVDRTQESSRSAAAGDEEASPGAPVESNGLPVAVVDENPPEESSPRAPVESNGISVVVVDENPPEEAPLEAPSDPSSEAGDANPPEESSPGAPVESNGLSVVVVDENPPEDSSPRAPVDSNGLSVAVVDENPPEEAPLEAPSDPSSEAGDANPPEESSPGDPRVCSGKESASKYEDYIHLRRPVWKRWSVPAEVVHAYYSQRLPEYNYGNRNWQDEYSCKKVLGAKVLKPDGKIDYPEITAKIMARDLVQHKGCDDEAVDKYKPLFPLNIALKIMDDAKNLFAKEDGVLKLNRKNVRTVGDIHGALDDLCRNLEVGWDDLTSSFLFLGDYVDRGPNSIGVVVFISLLKVYHPDRNFFLRGNHEWPTVNGSKLGFLEECHKVFGPEGGKKFYLAANALFKKLPVCAIIQDKIWCAHGGVSHHMLKGREAFLALIKKEPKTEEEMQAVLDVTWGDPYPIYAVDKKGQILFVISGRSKDSLDFTPHGLCAALDACGFEYSVRGHQVMTNGFSFFCGTRCITIFARTNNDSKGNYGCQLKINENLDCNFILFKNDDPNLYTKEEEKTRADDEITKKGKSKSKRSHPGAEKKGQKKKQSKKSSSSVSSAGSVVKKQVAVK